MNDRPKAAALDDHLLPWDRVIDSKPSLSGISLDEMVRYRDLLWLLTRRDIVTVYKQTVLGPIWLLLQPLLTTLVFVAVFGQVAQLSTDQLPRPLFYLSGIMLWNFFSDCFVKTASTFRESAPLFSKVYFPRILVPIAIVLSNLFRLSIQFLLFLAMWSWYWAQGTVGPTAAIMLFPLVLVIMGMIGLAFGLILSAMTTKYRDLMHLVTFGTQLIMYATPVFYPASQIPPSARPLFQWNPLIPLFEVMRDGFMGAGSWSTLTLSYSIVFSLLSLSVSILVFNYFQRDFVDTV